MASLMGMRSFQEVVERIGRGLDDGMAVAGGRLDRHMPHELAQGVDLFTGVGRVGVAEDMRGNKPVQPDPLRSGTHRALRLLKGTG